MGVHNVLYQFNNIEIIGKKMKIIDAESIMYGNDINMGYGRSLFHEAMFSSSDVVIDINIDGVAAPVDGYLSKVVVLSNIQKWALSKTNPFKKQKYFEQSVSNFLKKLKRKTKKKYFCWADVSIYDISGDSLSAIKRELTTVASLHKKIREKKNLSDDELSRLVKNTMWAVKNGIIVPKESYDKLSFSEIESWFYGDV